MTLAAGKKMKFLINSGHDYKDTGARYRNLTEAGIVMVVRNKIKALMPEVFFVPDDLDLNESIAWVNLRAQSGDFALGVHLNNLSNPNVRGMEVYYKDNLKIADFFSYQISKRTILPNRGPKHESVSALKSLGWLNYINCESLLLEM